MSTETFERKENEIKQMEREGKPYTLYSQMVRVHIANYFLFRLEKEYERPKFISNQMLICRMIDQANCTFKQKFCYKIFNRLVNLKHQPNKWDTSHY